MRGELCGFDSLEVQPLAHRWMGLMGRWMDGNFDLIRRWGDMYRREPTALTGRGPDLHMIAYVDRAIEIRLAAIDQMPTQAIAYGPDPMPAQLAVVGQRPFVVAGRGDHVESPAGGQPMA